MTRNKPSESVNLSRLSPFRLKLYTVIFRADTPAGKLFDALLLVAIAFSILVISLETVEGINRRYATELRIAEWIFTGLFTLEYALRLYCHPKRGHYAISFFGLVDLFSILPTYLSLIFIGSQYLLAIRALRLLRTARIFKLTRFISEGQMLTTALRASLAKILVFLGTILTLVVIIGSVMYLVEGRENGFTSIPVSIYWAIVTLTTVGYGDIAPHTPLGQMLASIVMVMGYGIIAVPTGIVTVELTKAAKDNTLVKPCPECFKELHDADAIFCSRCGHKLQTNN